MVCLWRSGAGAAGAGCTFANFCLTYFVDVDDDAFECDVCKKKNVLTILIIGNCYYRLKTLLSISFN